MTSRADVADRLITFPWPTPVAASPQPAWDGRSFWVGTRQARILEYDDAPSNWTAELTELHEVVAGAMHPIDVVSRQLAVESTRRFATPNPLVLDVGCSSGFLIDDIQRLIPGTVAIGADFLVEPLRSAAERLPGVPLLRFDLRRCPLPDACVDVVTALNVLEHIDDDALALRQLFRILRSRGVAHIEVPAGPHLYDLYDAELLHQRRYRLKSLVALARDAGFSIVRATHLGVLIYPAFAFVKRRNRRRPRLPSAEQREIVAAQIRTTAQSRLLAAILRTELSVGRVVDYPFGIRCVAVLRKP